MRALRRLVLLALVVGLVAAFWFASRGPRIERGSVLVMTLAGEYVEAAQPSLLAHLLESFSGRRAPLISVLSNLAKAERDDRLAAVVLRIRRLDVGWGKAQELREAIARVRQAGRRTVAFLEVESYGGNLEYYVATAADEIWLAEGTPAPLVGLKAEYVFLGGLWEKLGVDLDVLGKGEYKSAIEIYSARKMSPQHREMASSLLDSVTDQMQSDVAERRRLAPTEVSAAIDRAPMAAEEMKERALVDRLGHWDEVFEALGDPPRVDADTYARVSPESVGFDPVATFALVYGSGTVSLGDTAPRPGGGPVFASDPVVDALREAAKDPSLSAIILRIDSPGGSGPAAEAVWRAVVEARGSKPVVASFSDLAASAAYYVASAANRIVSQPATLTGSIGVFVMRPSFPDLLEKLGVGHEALTRGEHADLLAFTLPLSPSTRARFREDIERAYERFVGRVAEGRELSEEAVDVVARGRVWTGEQAVPRKLVDVLGGLRTAMNEAKRLADIDEDADVLLRPVPGPKPLAVELREAMGLSLRRAQDPEAPLLEPLREFAGWLAEAGSGAPVLVPPVWIDIR